MNVKYLIKEIMVILVLVFVLSNIISYIRQPELGSSQIQKIEVKLINGSIYNNKKDKPLVLHFWTTSCPACRLEAPNIETISKKYEVLSIAVNSGNDEKVKAYMNNNGLSFNVLNDQEGRWSTAYKIEAFPTTFIYDAKGKLRFTEVGYTTTAGLMARLDWVE